MTRIRYSELSSVFRTPQESTGPASAAVRPRHGDDAREVTSVVYVQRPKRVTFVTPVERRHADERAGHAARDVVYEERQLHSFEVTPGMALAWPRAGDPATYARFAIVARAADREVDGASLHVALHPYSRDLMAQARFKPGCNKGQEYIDRAMASAIASDDPDGYLDREVPYYLFATDVKEQADPAAGGSIPVRYAACTDPVRVARGTATGRQAHDPRLLIAVCTNARECRDRLAEHPNASLLKAAAKAGTLFQDYRFPTSRRGNWPLVAEGTRAKAGDALAAAIEFALAGPLSDDLWATNRRGGQERSVFDAVQAIFLDLMWNLHSREMPEHRESKGAARKRSEREEGRGGPSLPRGPEQSDRRVQRSVDEPGSERSELEQMRDRFLDALRTELSQDDGQRSSLIQQEMQRGLASDDPETVRSSAALGLALAKFQPRQYRDEVDAAVREALGTADGDAEVVLRTALDLLKV